MSSVKEYWSRASETVRSDFETSSSENSIEEYVEYRDASCNVDFDDDSDEPNDEDLPNVRTNSSKSIDELPESIEKNVDIEASRYVRWNVLMNLGIGLWSILCIVDLFQSEKSVTRDWLYELSWKEKDVLELVEEEKQLEAPILWYTNFWPYLWSIATIGTSAGAYFLLFILLIVFCTDPRLRKTFVRSSVRKNVSKRLVNKKLKNSVIVKKSSAIKKNPVSPLLHVSNIPKAISMRLKPPIYLQRKIQSCIEKPVKIDITKIDVLPTRSSCLASTGTQKSTTRFTINGALADLFEDNIRGTLIISRIDQFEWHATTKNSISLRSINASGRDLNLNMRTYDLEIGEYLKTRREILDDSFVITKRNLLNKPEVPINKKFRSRIITSSPAFKKFLSTYQQNARIS